MDAVNRTKTITPPEIRGAWADDFDTRCHYSEGAGPYRIVPAAVAVPKDTEDLFALVGWARKHKTSLTPRGAGSGMPGGNLGPGVVVDTREFDDAPKFVDESSVVCGAAKRWVDVDGIALTRGLRLPPDPASKNFCTVGGMVAANAAGPRSLRYGSIRNWVQALELVTADGEVEWIRRTDGKARTSATRRFQAEVSRSIRLAESAIRTAFPKTLKNSSGYALDHYLESGDLVDLIVGSEGTLGFITKVELRLDPVPAHKGTMLVMIPDTRCLSASISVLKNHDPTTIELLDSTFLNLAREHTTLDIETAEAVLIVDVERDSAEEVENILSTAKFELAGLASKVLTALSPGDAANLWQIRHAASPTLAQLPDNRRSLQIIEDGCVPVPVLAEYLERVKKAAAKVSIEIVAFGHAGDGHLHVNALVDCADPSLATKVKELLLDTTEIVAELGGTTCGEHGDGRLRAGSLEALYGREIVDLFRKVKQAFDPQNILNPGVILPNLRSPLPDLKVGNNAEKIPDRIATLLRNVERHATWGSPIDWSNDQEV